MQKAVVISLSDAERQTLLSWSRSRTAPARTVARARIVLLAADGLTNNAISAQLAIERTSPGPPIGKPCLPKSCGPTQRSTLQNQ